MKISSESFGREELKNIYQRLLWALDSVSEKDLPHFSLFARLDARLLELLIKILAENFQRFNPIAVRNGNNESANPALLCAIIENCTPLIKKTQQKLWPHWKKCIQSEVEPAPFQSFLVSQDLIRPLEQQNEIRNNLETFKRWGFYNSEPPYSLKQNTTRTILRKKDRLRSLERYLQKNKTITVNEYLKVLSGLIARRQAQRDLKAFSGLKGKGFTHRRKYSKSVSQTG